MLVSNYCNYKLQGPELKSHSTHLHRPQNWTQIMSGNGWRDEDEDRIQGAKYLKHEIFGAKCHTGDEITATGHPPESGPVTAGPHSRVANGGSELDLKG